MDPDPEADINQKKPSTKLGRSKKSSPVQGLDVGKGGGQHKDAISDELLVDFVNKVEKLTNNKITIDLDEDMVESSSQSSSLS